MRVKKNNYQLYYKTDNHWTTYGAYFGYKEFSIKNNIEYIDISKFNIETITDSFKGSTYSKVVEPFSDNENIDIFNYKDYDLDVNYVLFLDNNHPLITITNNDLDNNILILKDSYANSMIPLLTKHYKEIHIIDPRYYKKSITKYIKEYNIDNNILSIR